MKLSLTPAQIQLIIDEGVTVRIIQPLPPVEDDDDQLTLF